MDRAARLDALEERILRRINDGTGPHSQALDRLLAEVRRKRHDEELSQWPGDTSMDREA
jgi:hypothetical protein